MIRKAFKMKVHKGCEEEYKKRHNEIWPELVATLKGAGISDYSIFFDPETLILFAMFKLTDDNTERQLRDNPIMRKWWDYMADIMETRPDNSPNSAPLHEVFHLD